MLDANVNNLELMSKAKLNHRRWSMWTIEVYHTQNGNANITLYLFRNTERKFCMEEWEMM